MTNSAPYFRVTSPGDADATGPRTGVLITPHGEIETPAFMPVATQGSVKALSPGDVESLGGQVVICNAYHLALRPGVELIEAAGGLHGFMGWNRPIATDSGGLRSRIGCEYLTRPSRFSRTLTDGRFTYHRNPQ